MEAMAQDPTLSQPSADAAPERAPAAETPPQMPPTDDIHLSGEPSAPGLRKEQDYRMQGFSEDQIAEHRQKKIAEFRQQGFTDPQIKDYFGIKEPDTSGMKATLQKNLEAAAKPNPDAGPTAQPKPATNLLEAFEYGWQMSVTGLAKRGKAPDFSMPEDASYAMQIAEQVPQLAGDLPAMIAGWYGGSALGAFGGGVAGSVVPGVGTLGGVAAGYYTGGTGGAFAAPAMLREALLEQYTKGPITNSRDFATRLAAVTWEGAKGFITGAATELTGGAVQGKVLEKTGSMFLSDVARFSAELPTMVGVAKGLEGQLPNSDDFGVAGIVLGGFHGVRMVGPKLMSLYKEKGTLPGDALQAAKTDVELKQNLIAQDSDIVPYEPPQPEKPATLKQQAKDLATAVYKDGYQNFFDSIKPTQEISDKVYQMLDMQKTWKNKAYVMSRWSTRDFANPTKVTGEGFEPIIQDGLKAVKGEEISPEGEKILKQMDPEISKREGTESKILSAYLVARTAIERAEKTPEKATGIDYDAAQKFVSEHRAALEPVAKRFTEFGNRIVEYGRDAGLYDAAGVRAMLAAHENHAPLSRIMDEDPLTGQKPKSRPVKKFEGSERTILDPIHTQVENMNAIIRASEENRSRAQIAKDLEANPNPELGRFVKPRPEAVQVEGSEISKWLKQNGVDADVPDAPFTVFRRGYGGLADNQIPFFENGKMRVMELRPDIAEGIKSLDYQPGTSSLILRSGMAILRASAQFAKKSITNSPAFAERNYFRDQFDKIVNDKKRELPILPSLQALGHFFGEDKVWQDYLMSGAIGEGHYDWEDYHKIDFDKISEEQGIKDHIWNMVKSPTQALRLYEHLLGGVEAAPRIATAKSEGLLEGNFDDLLRAGWASKESTVNFLKSGLKTRAVAPMFKFLTPGLAGIERTTRGLADPEVWHRGFYAMTIPTVVNWMANKDDERYQSIPPYKLNQGWPIITDQWAPAVNRGDFDSRPESLRRIVDGQYQVNNGAIHFIPKPPGYGTIFATIPEAILNAFYKKNMKAFDGFGGSILDSYMPDIQVNAATPFLEMWANKNTFTGNPIVPDHLKELVPELQWTTYTTETAKQLGKLIGASPLASDIGSDGIKIQSPLNVDTFIRDWTGPTGVAIVGIIDKALHAAGVGNQSAEPYHSLSENPYINGFVYRFPNARVQDVDDFYRRYSAGSAAVMSMSKSMKSGDLGQAEWIQDHYGQQMVRLKYVNDALSMMNKTIQAVVMGRGEFEKMKGVEKRQLIDSTYYQMWQVAKEGNRQMDTFEKQLKENKLH